MATLNLSSYHAVQTIFFVRIEVPGNPDILMTDYYTALSPGDGFTYTGLGQFLGITDTSSDLRLNNSEVTISISGIPTTSVTDFLSRPMKGSKVTVKRGVYNPGSQTFIGLTGKFRGMINNYAITDSQVGANASTTISLICKSLVGMVQARTTGRRTNPTDERLFFPTDKSMDRVPSLAGAKIMFGGV